MYSRLQTRLNPVPESLNSPDIAPPSSAGLIRARDDPVRVYNRELAISSSTVSTTSSSQSTEPTSTISTSKLQQQQQQQQQQQSRQQQQQQLRQQQKLQKQASDNGYNSSSSDGDQHQRNVTSKTTTTISTSNSTTLKSKKSNVPTPTSAIMTTSMIESRIDSGKGRPMSASRSTSLGRKSFLIIVDFTATWAMPRLF